MLMDKIRNLSKPMALTTFSVQLSRSMKLHVSAFKLGENADAGNVQVTESADSRSAAALTKWKVNL